MGCVKLSVTIPDKLYNDARETAMSRHIKLSHLVADALGDKLKQIKEEKYLELVNAVYIDEGAATSQKDMAESIATDMNIEELPW